MTVLEYFNGNELAASVWKSKYALKNKHGEIVEELPSDMHKRMAKEFARIEFNYKPYDHEAFMKNKESLSKYGFKYLENTKEFNQEDFEHLFYNYFDKFKYIVPQGSIMAMLGNPYQIGSLSNCFVIAPPLDSYGGIFKTDQEIAQLEKRRGGVGTHLNTLRPDDTPVSNAAGTSTGAHSFAERFSNTTREVAQNGRRGALMLLMSCMHPDIFKFVSKKSDLTKVTGANISVMLTNEFMNAAMANMDYLCKFPLNAKFDKSHPAYESVVSSLDYNKLEKITDDVFIMKIKAKELFDLIVTNAWQNAEPGVAFIDRITNYCPEAAYSKYLPIASNPCGEQWMQAYDACRLLAVNFFSCVIKPFTKNAEIDFEKLYEISYMQQKLADNLIDLEIEAIIRILEKIDADPEPMSVKKPEYELWMNIKATAERTRRTGCGFTGLGDMLAAINVPYANNPKTMAILVKALKTKMAAELDCTIDLAILRGAFKDFNAEMEFGKSYLDLARPFHYMLDTQFPEQTALMTTFGRRNLSWSTVAPTGSVSILTETTSGLEPLFQPYYIRRKKINPDDKDAKIDFKDELGDCWTEFFTIHPKFKNWIDMQENVPSNLNKEILDELFKKSPWYKSCANDISSNDRIAIQSVIQRYTTNAISATVNLPENVSKDVVADLYYMAYLEGLKGLTIYREGSRSGVLINSTAKKGAFTYQDAPKRPNELPANIFKITSKGDEFIVIVGLFDNNPYEVFALKNTFGLKQREYTGTVKKSSKRKYDLYVDNTADGILKIEDITQYIHNEEEALTRMISTALRHGSSIQFIVDQLNKSHGTVVSFSKAIARVLSKYVKSQELTSEKCPECGETSLIKEEGCTHCTSCGYSKC